MAQAIQQGWPKYAKNVNTLIRPYFNVRDELAIDNGIIMRGERPVIPAKLQKEYIKLLHAGHLGIDLTKQRARDVEYWATMNQEIEDELRPCNVCTSLKSHQQKEPLMLYPVPDMPWSTVAADLMDWNGMQYLVLVDSYSGWFEICHLSSITSAMVIKKLKCQFSRFGSPENLITDNACQFSSREFASFIKE